jgi:hypothetical protein
VKIRKKRDRMGTTRKIQAETYDMDLHNRCWMSNVPQFLFSLVFRNRLRLFSNMTFISSYTWSLSDIYVMCGIFWMNPWFLIMCVRQLGDDWWFFWTWIDYSRDHCWMMLFIIKCTRWIGTDTVCVSKIAMISRTWQYSWRVGKKMNTWCQEYLFLLGDMSLWQNIYAFSVPISTMKILAIRSMAFR